MEDPNLKNESDERYRLRKELEESFKSYIEGLNEKISSEKERRIHSELESNLENKFNQKLLKNNKEQFSKIKCTIAIITVALGIFGITSITQVPKIIAKKARTIIEDETSLAVVESLKKKISKIDSFYTKSQLIYSNLEQLQSDVKKVKKDITPQIVELLRSDNEFIKRTKGPKGEPGTPGDSGNAFNPLISNKYSIAVDKKTKKNEVYMTSTYNSICFLTSVEFSDLDRPKEKGLCEISKQNPELKWILKASMGTSGRAWASCKARCISW